MVERKTPRAQSPTLDKIIGSRIGDDPFYKHRSLEVSGGVKPDDVGQIVEEESRSSEDLRWPCLKLVLDEALGRAEFDSVQYKYITLLRIPWDITVLGKFSLKNFSITVKNRLSNRRGRKEAKQEIVRIKEFQRLAECALNDTVEVEI